MGNITVFGYCEKRGKVAKFVIKSAWYNPPTYTSKPRDPAYVESLYAAFIAKRDGISHEDAHAKILRHDPRPAVIVDAAASVGDNGGKHTTYCADGSVFLKSHWYTGPRQNTRADRDFYEHACRVGFDAIQTGRINDPGFVAVSRDDWEKEAKRLGREASRLAALDATQDAGFAIAAE